VAFFIWMILASPVVGHVFSTDGARHDTGCMWQ
jgi:hypothetical protein